MKKLNTLLVAIAVLATAITGCSGTDNADPKSVLVAFFEKMSKKDLEGAAKLATKDSKATIDMMKKAMDVAEKFKDGEKKEEDPAEDFKNMVVGETKIDGDNATVSVTNKKKNETVDFPLKKEGGGWKVDFSMATLMKMGMDKNKKEEGENPGGGTDENFNMDSLQNGLKQMDSALKSIKPEDLEKAKSALDELKKASQN
jgi:hypothetical protein